MPSYEHPNREHQKLVDRITQLDTVPEDAAAYQRWVTAEGHLDLLRENAGANELIVYASGAYTFMHSIVVPEERLSRLDENELYNLCNLPRGRAHYFRGTESDDVGIDSEKIDRVHHLVFSREIPKFDSDERDSLEIMQEYCHLAGIHWRDELSAYCRLNRLGDVEQGVSITSHPDRSPVTLVSFMRHPLEEYLVVSNSVLIRAFEFFLHSRRTPVNPADNDPPQETQYRVGTLLYTYHVNAGIHRTYGIQLLRPGLSKGKVIASLKGEQVTEEDDPPVEFMSWCFRDAPPWNRSEDSPLPPSRSVPADGSVIARTSHAFFNPEVLLEYKNSEKYEIIGNRITCRSEWSLRYHENNARQIHTLVYYLSEIPKQEQYHWKKYNEEPRRGIARGVYETAIEGMPYAFDDPLLSIRQIITHWDEDSRPWWKLKVPLSSVNKPLSTSRNEWARAFSALSKLLIEGFQPKSIRSSLRAMDIEFSKDDKSILLLEKLLVACNLLKEKQQLEGLRKIQQIRTYDSHASGLRLIQLAKDSLAKHGTYTAHFESVCRIAVGEIEMIEQAISENLRSHGFNSGE